MWSVGCILAELHGRKPLFPGDDCTCMTVWLLFGAVSRLADIQQMDLIFNVLGTPDLDDMSFITNAKAMNYIKSLRKKPSIDLGQKFRNANPQGSSRDCCAVTC